MKKEVSGGMGCVLLAMANSEWRLGRAVTPSSYSSMSVNSRGFRDDIGGFWVFWAAQGLGAFKVHRPAQAYLLVDENRKNALPAGIGTIVFLMLTSDMRRGRAVNVSPPPSPISSSESGELKICGQHALAMLMRLIKFVIFQQHLNGWGIWILNLLVTNNGPAYFLLMKIHSFFDIF